MSTATSPTMKLRSGDGGMGDMSPTSPYPTGSMVRSRPKLPKMENRTTTLSPERKQCATVSTTEERTTVEDLERDLDMLRRTDFTSKYSRRLKASGTTSPSGSSRPMSPSHPGHHTSSIRRIESLRMKLVKVKESQDRAERASRELKKSIPGGRRTGVVQPPTSPDNGQGQSIVESDRRWINRDSQSAESNASLKRASPTNDQQVEQGRTQVATGSVPMTPSVNNNQHHQRAWSEPNHPTSSRQSLDEDEETETAPIRYKQGSINSTDSVTHVVLTHRETEHVPVDSPNKHISFTASSPDDSLGDSSTPSDDPQSKTSSCSTLKDTFESDDDPPKTVKMLKTRPKIPEVDRVLLLGNIQSTGQPLSLKDSSDLVISNRDSLTPENTQSLTNNEQQRSDEDLQLKRSHLQTQEATDEGGPSPNRSNLWVSKGEDGNGVEIEDRIKEDSLLHAYIPSQGRVSQDFHKGAPSRGGAAFEEDAKSQGSVCTTANEAMCGEVSKVVNGRFITHPLMSTPESTELPVIADLVPTVEGNGQASLHEPSEQSAPSWREPTSQVSLGHHLVDTDHQSPSGSTETSSLDLASCTDETESVASEDMDKFERRNGRSLKHKSKSDPSGEKHKDALAISSLGGSRAQSTSEINKNDQARDKVTGSSALPKSSELMIKDVLEMKRNLDSKLKGDRQRPSIFNRGMRKTSDEHSRRASSGDPPTSDPEASTTPSSPLSQSPSGTLHRVQQASPTSSSPSLKLDVSSTGLSTSLSTGLSTGLSRSTSSASTFSSVHRQRPTGLDFNAPRRLHHRPAVGDLFGQYRQRQDRPFGSTLSLMDTQSKDKRELIVEELVETEQQYVESLLQLVNTYMIPMKTQGVLDSKLVDDIFYKINEISTHHAMFLAFLEQALGHWDNSSSTIGDVIQRSFSRETVIENYVSFIENFPRAEKVLDELINKSTFQKFLEQCERETRSKLPLKAQIVKPAQRIPRYELLLRRLIENTPRDHPDYEPLLKAEGAIHEVALRINSVKESKHEESLQETLRTLEFLLVTDLVAPERLYHRHDMVQILSRKDQCCIWLFSDLAVLTCIKRKSGPVNRRSTLLLKSPTGQDFVENAKHKVWMKVPLDDVEIVKGATTFSQKQLVDREQLDDDLAIMTQISDLTLKLKGAHQVLDEAVHEMLSQLNKQLSEHQLKPPPPDACRVQLMATTHEGVTSITAVFPSPEKKLSWESAFVEIKQKLATLSDGKPPEFLQALQITKTRAGMQFSCAAPIEGLNACQQRDVWVCNSDGYVGHMCLLSLQPEPIVTLNTPVPGCNSRILCICAVPAFHGCKRKASMRRTSKAQQQQQQQQKTPSTSPVTIHVESFEGGSGHEDGDESLSDLSSSTSDQGSDDDHDDTTLHIHTGDQSASRRSRSPSLSRSESGREGVLQDPYKSTMWLGTEDGCIHIFLCTDNIKTTKNKVKIQQNAGVLGIVHVDQKVFVSLDNGDLVVYRRSTDGVWDMTMPDTVSIGNASSPVTKMLLVAGRLWCACQNNIIVLNPATLCQEFQFAVSLELKRSIQCMASSGQGVWVAGQSSSKVLLYHATTYEHLLEVSITQAVAQKLQTADDIIRQHKTACLRITALLACKDLLWIGTSAGVVLTLVMPKVTASTTRATLSQPTVNGLVQGHTGHVRFLTSVEMPSSSKRSSTMDSPAVVQMTRRASVSLHLLTMATRMLVISGGDGYEDFRSSSSNEAAGRDDSTNHLLLWQV